MGYSPQGCRVRHHAGTKQQQSTTLHPTEAGDRWAPGICHLWTAADAAKLLQSCPTLSDTTDSSPAGSSVHRILQARILEWVVIPFSRRSSLLGDQTQVSCTAGRFFTIWAAGEALSIWYLELFFLELQAVTYSTEFSVAWGQCCRGQISSIRVEQRFSSRMTLHNYHHCRMLTPTPAPTPGILGNVLRSCWLYNL